MQEFAIKLYIINGEVKTLLTSKNYEEIESEFVAISRIMREQTNVALTTNMLSIPLQNILYVELEVISLSLS